MPAILWTAVAILLLFWLVGILVGNLGNIVWIALVIAVVLALYNLFVRRPVY